MAQKTVNAEYAKNDHNGESVSSEETAETA
jgi:hypothetical protein